MSSKKSRNTKDILKRFKEALNIKTDSDLAKYLGVKQNTISTWKARDSLDYKLLFSKCDENNINLNWLLTGEGDMFRKKQDSVEFVPAVVVPVIGAQVPDGFPAMPPEDDCIEDYLYVPGVPDGSYAVRVKGDSMSPTIRDGDYVVLVPNAEVRSGDIVVVLNEWNEVILRRYREKNGEVFLTSDNPEYPTVRPSDDYKIIGRAVKKVRVEDV